MKKDTLKKYRDAAKADKTMAAYREAAIKIMQIADDEERMRQIRLLIDNINEKYPFVVDFCKHMVLTTRILTPNGEIKESAARWDDYLDCVERGLKMEKWSLDDNGHKRNVDLDYEIDPVFLEMVNLYQTLETEYDILATIKTLTPPTPDTAAGVSYKSNRDEAELTAIFNALTGKTKPQDTKEKNVVKYLPADSDLQGWLWICTGRLGKQPKEPLKWLGAPTELALMVGELFGTKWKVTRTWFIYNSDVDGQWKQPTIAFLSKQYIAGKENGIKNRSYLWKILKPFCPETQD